MKKNKISWTGKSYGGYWGTLSFALLLRVGILPAYVLLVFVSAFFVVFRRSMQGRDFVFKKAVQKHRMHFL